MKNRDQHYYTIIPIHRETHIQEVCVDVFLGVCVRALVERGGAG